MSFKVWLMIIVAAKNNFMNTTVDFDIEVFNSAENCIKNIPMVEKELRKDFSEVKVRCVERNPQ